MISRFHYDESTMRGLLEGGADNEDSVLKHVESCEVCQQHLETLAQDGITCAAAGRLLRDDSYDDAVATDEENCAVQTRAFLKPTDHPESLGRFGRYEIMEFLGRGGMGIVMRGFDSALNRHSAIKVLAPELASNAAARRRFSREARSAAAVVHPHVVPIQTVDKHEGLPYLVMPVVEGRSLEERVRISGPLEIIEVVRIGAQVAEGLAAAHAQGLVHRDIKPANVLLENGVERVQITDFGLARAIDDASTTRSGVIAGTPQYMSPEQAHGDAIDHRSDLFSLGSLIYFMCTGRSPFRAETTMGVLKRIVDDEPRPLREINSDVPEWLTEIVARLLKKSPDDRIQSADEASELLNRWLAHLQAPDTTEAPSASSVTGAASAIDFQPASRKSTGRASGTPASRQISTSDVDNSVRRGWLRALAFAALPLLVLLGAVIWLETGKGRIRIQTNSVAAVPIRIRQGTETVEELTITKPGNTTRLRAGNYTIEVEDVDGWEVIGNEVKLTRGGEWVATLREAEFMDDGDASRSAASLEEQLAAIAKKFYLALKNDRRDDAAELLSPDAEDRLKRTITSESFPLKPLREITFGQPEITINGDKALASFPPVQWRAESGDTGYERTLVPGVILHRVDGRWGVFGSDFISPENAKRELANWRAASKSERQAKSETREYDVTDIPVAERGELRKLIQRLALDPEAVTTVSNLTDDPTKWFIFTTPAGHQRVARKLSEWRTGDHAVPLGTPASPTTTLMTDELSEAADTDLSDAPDPEPLYAGEPLSTWQQRFDAETNPVSKINAATALVALSDRQPAEQQIQRMLELGGLLVTAGWNDDVDRFFGDYGRSGKHRFRPNQWSTDVYPELYEAWDKFFDSVELRFDAKVSKHAKLVGDRVASAITGPTMAEAAFATWLLEQLVVPYSDEPEFCDAVLSISLKDDSPLRRHLNVALADFYPGASDAGKRQYLRRAEAMGQSFAVESGLPVDWDFAHEWLSQQLENEVALDDSTLTRTVKAMLIDDSDRTLDYWFAFSALHEGEHPYLARSLSSARARGKLWDIWLPEVNRTLAANPQINERLRKVLTTLEVQLRVRKSNDDWPVKELVQRLQEQLQTRTLEESQSEVISNGINEHNRDGYRQRALSAATNHDLLAYIILAGGELPQELLTRKLPGDDSQLQQLQAAFDTFENGPEKVSSADFDKFNARAKSLPHLLEIYPVATVRILMDGLTARMPDTLRVSLSYRLRMLTERGSGANSPPPIEPLLLLAIFAELPEANAKLDEAIADIFKSDDDELTDHLEAALESDFAVRDVAIKWLRRLRSRTDNEEIIQRIDKLLPGDVRDRAEFIKSNPDSFEAVLEAFNAGSREERKTLFDPPIPDLTLQQLRDAFRVGAAEYRKAGKHNVADSLEASLKQGRLVKGLNTPGIGGTSAKSDDDGRLAFRQFAPMMTLDTGPSSGMAVVLSSIELRWSKNWSSSDYGDIHPPIDGTWKLVSVEQDGKKLKDSALNAWLKANRSGLREFTIRGQRLLTSGQQTAGAADTKAPEPTTYDLKFDYSHMLPRLTASRGGVEWLDARFMSNMFTDGDKLTIVFDPNGGPAPKSFKTDDTKNIKLVYARVGAAGATAATKKGEAPDSNPTDAVMIVVGAQGKITVDGKTVALEELDKLFDGGAIDSETRAKLSINPEIPYANVIAVMDRLKKSGVEDIGLMVLPVEDSANKESRKLSPEIPAVKINVTNEQGKPRSGVTVTLRSTDKNAKRLEVEATSGEDGLLFDRVLPYGPYYLNMETDDGWSARIREVNVEFDKGLTMKLVAPTANQIATIQLNEELEFDKIDHIESMPFGSLEMHDRRSLGFTPQAVPAPGKPNLKYSTFPTLGKGIAEIGVNVTVEVHRSLRTSSGETVDWSWRPEDGRLNFLLTADELRAITDNGYSRIEPPKDNGMFNVTAISDVPKVAYYQLQFSDSSPLPYVVKLPAGAATIYLTAVCGRPTAEIAKRLLGDKGTEEDRELWLPVEIRKDSEWIEHLFDMGKAESSETNWKRMEGGGRFHLLRREISLTPDATATVSLKSASPDSPPQSQ